MGAAGPVAGERIHRSHGGRTAERYRWSCNFADQISADVSRLGENSSAYYKRAKEHRRTLDDFITDSDTVLLLRALTAERAVMILPAVDPVTEVSGAQGVVVAQVFQVKATGVDSFARLAEQAFARYRAAGRGRPGCW